MTPNNDSICFALGIKDSNLILMDYFYAFINLAKGTRKKLHPDIRKCRIYEFKLRNQLITCPNCHHRCLVKFGYSTVQTIFTTDDASHPVFLRIHKQRLRCKDCRRTFMAQSNVVRKYCHIANKVRAKATMSFQDDRSLESIARDNTISPSTVLRYLDASRSIAPLHQHQLPTNLAMDEFRGVHRQLHFICIDNDHHRIQTILPDRFKRTIENYFLSFTPAERSRVKTISVDLNSYYQDIARRLFPHAEIIIDRFHIIAMMTRAFNQYRAQAMKQFPKTSRQYRLLKFSWQLYLKSATNLSYEHEYYDRHLRQKVTSGERVDLGLAINDRLRADYQFLQNVMQNLKQRNLDQLTESLYPGTKLSPQMTAVLHTLRHNLMYVLNASRFDYSNGTIEGINRMIKQIQRTAFGFRNYNHLVYRIQFRQMAQKKNQAA